MAVSVHFKCRNAQYAGGVERFPVPDDRVSWSVDWPEYKPVDYTAPSVQKGPVWADPEIRWIPCCRVDPLILMVCICE